MSEPGANSVGRRLGAGATMLAIGLVLVMLGASAGEDALMRQLKIDVFDQNWSAVLQGCDDLLARFPDSPARSQAAFYRTRALSRLAGREQEAIQALRAFLKSPPGDRLLVEEAWSSLFTIACAPDRRESAACRDVLRGGMADSLLFVSTLAAIRAADIDDRPIRRLALPLLKKAYETQIDVDIRNEILIAILKIAPGEVPAPRVGAGRLEPRASGRTGEPTLIRMTVFNKTEDRFEIKVQFPVAFARMLIDALGEERKGDLRREARRQGLNIDEIFEAIQRSGLGRLLEVDTGEVKIEIWIE